MKILLANSFLYLTGGADKVFLDEVKLLEREGHSVFRFGMMSNENPSTPCSRYHVSGIDFRGVMTSGSIARRMGAAVRVLYSREAFSKFAHLLRDERPDIVHFHNIQNHLSLAILRAAKLAEVPAVWTLHDYELFCPNTHFLRKGEICEKCAGRRFYKTLIYKCKKEDLFASALAAVSTYFQHYVLRVIDNISVFVSPSLFLRNKMVSLGISANKIIYLPNPVELPAYNTKPPDSGYGVYVGRLTKEKGVALAIRASVANNIPLYIVGDGPERRNLEILADDLGAYNCRFTGFLNRSEVALILRKARFSVLPSICYENFPLAIIESYAEGTPLIASRLGGCINLIDDGIDGYLFNPGDPSDLARKMSWLFQSPEQAHLMGELGRKKIAKLCSPAAHYHGLMTIYRRALEGRMH